MSGKLFYCALGALYVTSFASVVVTAYIPGYETLLKTATRENGFFESLSVLALLATFFYGGYFCFKYRRSLSKRNLFLIGGFALLAFVGAMEEISWGQQLLHFQSGDYFQTHNMQKETNLHNLIPAEIFSSVIYVSFYTVFVFVPLLAIPLRTKIAAIDRLQAYLPSPQTTLIVIYAASFQAYFYDDFGAYFDMATQLFAVALFGVMLLLKKIDKSHLLHYLWVLFGTITFLFSYRVFGFYNMQYEIRELLCVMAVLAYYMQLTHAFVAKDAS